MPRLRLTPEQKKEMMDACAKADPLEACGIVAGGVLYQLENHSARPGTFALRAEDIRKVAEHHGGYEGIWHSHPSGNPLPSDVDWASHPPAKALVVATRTLVRVYYGDDSEV